MDNKIKEFIEKNINLIDNDEWEEIYKKAANELAYNTGKFTEVILAADIHPENYLTELPENFCKGSDIKNFTIPNNIKSIGVRAFQDCTSLTNIIIPDRVTSISDSAFRGCTSLTSAEIGNSVKSIIDLAFSGCTSLTKVLIGNGIISIGYKAFSGCTSLTNMAIENGIISIGESAFYNCPSLESITIPDSVSDIGDYAFSSCGDKLIIEYSGSKEDWKNIYTRNAFEYTYFTVNCTDGKIVKKRR